MGADDDVLRSDSHATSDFGSWYLGTERQQARCSDRRSVHLAVATAPQSHVHEACRALERHGVTNAETTPRQHACRSDIGMARKGHLGGPVEDPYARGMRRLGRREDECRLAEVELRSERLHLSIGKTTCVEHDRELIAAETAIGEDVHRLEEYARQRTGGIMVNMA